ncbi:AAA family ATPase [Streptomyces sp. NPDC058676]|uniref:AAA family ATPase n=1 Tax=unclassified Streptomyces TaxID=2593676 RepID=UPI003655FB09
MTGNATNVEEHVRVGLVMAAKRHGMPTVAVIVATPLSLRINRQGPRPANRRVPEDTVRAQHEAMTYSHQRLAAEGFNTIVVADSLHRLEPLLRRASNTRRAELGWDDGDGLGDLLLVRRTFGSEVLGLWSWREQSQLASGDCVGEIRLGADRMVLALRTDVDGEGDVGFDLLVACPFDDDCDAPAWAPVFSVTDLLTAHTSDTGQHPHTVCTVHGGADDVDQEADDYANNQDDDPEGSADIVAQAMEAVRG